MCCCRRRGEWCASRESRGHALCDGGANIPAGAIAGCRRDQEEDFRSHGHRPDRRTGVGRDFCPAAGANRRFAGAGQARADGTTALGFLGDARAGVARGSGFCGSQPVVLCAVPGSRPRLGHRSLAGNLENQRLALDVFSCFFRSGDAGVYVAVRPTPPGNSRG